MNIIEQLGGYERAKYEFEMIKEMKPVYLGEIETNNRLLLEYRRQHNIFEVGDKVVYVDDFMPDSVSVVSEVNDRVWLNGNNAVCIKEIIKHAEDEEIAAGRRINNDMGDDAHKAI